MSFSAQETAEIGTQLAPHGDMTDPRRTIVVVDASHDTFELLETYFESFGLAVHWCAVSEPEAAGYFSCSVRTGSQSASGGEVAISCARSRNSAAGRSVSADRLNDAAAAAKSRARQCASPSA